MEYEKLLRSGTAARRLGISPQTLWNWSKKWDEEKIGPEPIMIDGMSFYHSDDIDRFLAESEGKTENKEEEK